MDILLSSYLAHHFFPFVFHFCLIFFIPPAYELLTSRMRLHVLYTAKK